MKKIKFWLVFLYFISASVFADNGCPGVTTRFGNSCIACAEEYRPQLIEGSVECIQLTNMRAECPPEFISNGQLSCMKTEIVMKQCLGGEQYYSGQFVTPDPSGGDFCVIRMFLIEVPLMNPEIPRIRNPFMN